MHRDDDAGGLSSSAINGSLGDIGYEPEPTAPVSITDSVQLQPEH
jgi:hypothetical protein